MDPPIAPPPRQRYITSQAHFYQRKAEKEAAAFNAMVPGNFADFPTRATDQCFLVDQMMAAMKDTTDILDNPDNNAHINCIRAKSDDDLEEKAWEAMFDAYDAQRGKRVHKLLTAYFPNFMDRWEALVALMRTKLSNNHTNKMRDFNKDVKAASKFGGSVTTVDRITSVYDAAGNLVRAFVRPEKRPLSDFLGNRLAGIAKPKRARTRAATGDSTISVPASSNSSNSEQPVAGTAGGPMTPIQEEEEDDHAMAAIHEDEEGVMATTQGKEEGAVGEVEKDDGYEALEGPNGLSTPSPDAFNPHFNNQYPTPTQHLPLGEQSNIANQHPIYPTPDQHESLGEQSEQPSPNGYTVPPNNEMDANPFPLSAEAHHEPIASHHGEDVGIQAALDGRATNNGHYLYEVDLDWYEL
ncbi:hypothetical protein B0H65DRAFT_579582, partial [Neurospora tetraspora]